MRRDHLHISLCFEWEAEVELLEAVREAWHGRMHHMRAYRYGASMYAFHDDALCQCPHIAALYSLCRRYRGRGLHMAF